MTEIIHNCPAGKDGTIIFGSASIHLGLPCIPEEQGGRVPPR